MTTINDFQIIKKVGDGAYSQVYKVRRIQDNTIYALKKVKIASLSQKEKENALNEVRILASINHPNIISYKEAFFDEFADNGDLYQKIVEQQKKQNLFPEPFIWNMFIQSANVFLNKDGSVKLGDLNVSKIAKKGLLYTQTGTPYYASPEVWKDQPYDIKSDIWSLGCVLYEAITLKPPFRAENMEGLYKKVVKGYIPKIPSIYSQDLNNLIRILLQVNPKNRPNTKQIFELDCIENWMNMTKFEDDEPTNNNNNSFLLQTIKMPKKLTWLSEKLPKSNYNNEMLTGGEYPNKFELPKLNSEKNSHYDYMSLVTNEDIYSRKNNGSVIDIINPKSIKKNYKNLLDPANIKKDRYLGNINQIYNGNRIRGSVEPEKKINRNILDMNYERNSSNSTKKSLEMKGRLPGLSKLDEIKAEYFELEQQMLNNNKPKKKYATIEEILGSNY